MKNETIRHLHLVGATGKIRTAVYNGTDHLVVPVVMMVEGVVWAVNSKYPELVLAEDLAEATYQWNGRACFAGHPKDGDTQVTANTPRTLEKSFGIVFDTVSAERVLETKRLECEAYLDPIKAAQVGPEAEDVIRRLQNGETVEVSVGCYVVAEQAEGSYNGKKYVGIWRDITSDHLAFLASDETGACSVKAGCGAGRAAVRHLVAAQGVTFTASDIVSLRVINRDGSVADQPEVIMADEVKEKDKSAEKPVEEKKLSLKDRVLDFFQKMRASEGVSDMELRHKLSDALRATEPGFMGVSEVFPDDGLVIFESAPGDEWQTMRRSYSIADDGVITLGEAAEQVEQRVVYEVKAAASSPSTPKQSTPPKSTPTPKSAPAPKSAEANEIKTLEETPCGCGGHKTEEPEIITSTAKGTDMTKEQRAEVIKALTESKHSGFTSVDAAMLEAASDERLDAFLVQTESRKAQVKAAQDNAQPKTLSEEDWMAQAPLSIKRVLSRAQAEEAEAKAHLVTALVASQDEYTESELASKEVVELQRMARMQRIADTDNYSGRAIPRTRTAKEQTEDVYLNPPDPYAEALKTRH